MCFQYLPGPIFSQTIEILLFLCPEHLFLHVPVNWLDHAKTLREQGINTDEETLLLRRKFFFSDQNVDARDPVQLNLLFVQVRQPIRKQYRLKLTNQKTVLFEISQSENSIIWICQSENSIIWTSQSFNSILKLANQKSETFEKDYQLLLIPKSVLFFPYLFFNIFSGPTQFLSVMAKKDCQLLQRMNSFSVKKDNLK